MRSFFEYRRRRQGRIGFMQKVLLTFLLGFLFGALFYYLFRHSFEEIYDQWMDHMTEWKKSSPSFFSGWIRSVWNHGKYLGLFLLLASNHRVKKELEFFWVEVVYTLYAGIRSGFLLVFFLVNRGIRGIWLYGITLFPHSFVLTGMYLFCFYWMGKWHYGQRFGMERSRGSRILFFLGTWAILLIAAGMETKWNLPLVSKFLS